MRKSHISTKTLKKLKSKLPYGSITRIATELGLDKSVVSRVLNGEVYNQNVIDFAVLIIKETKSLEQSINEL